MGKKWWVLGIVLSIVPLLSHAGNTFVFLEPNTLFGPAFKPKIVLYKIQDIANGIQAPANGPDTVEVSLQELKKVKDSLARGDKEPGSFNKKIKLIDGNTVTAGEYYLMEYRSYKYLNESKEAGKNYLLETFQQAEKSGEEFRGPTWNIMVEMLNDPVKAKLFGCISGWGYSPQEWTELFLHLKRKGIIKYLPDESHLHSLRRNTEYYENGDTIEERKQDLIYKMALNFKRMHPLNEKHTLVYADADQKDFAAVYKKLFFAIKGSYTPAQVILINGGSQTEIRESELPKAFSVELGGPRKLTTKEVNEALSMTGVSAVPSSAVTCEGLFQ